MRKTSYKHSTRQHFLQQQFPCQHVAQKHDTHQHFRTNISAATPLVPKANRSWVREETKHVQRAAQRGDVSAMHEMAQRCFFGRQTKQDKNQALGWCMAAAERGYVPSITMYASCLITGTYVAQDPRQGVSLLLAAAKGGCAVAWFNLGICSERGIGIKQDARHARRCYEHAAEMGLPAAERELGRCYLQGIGGPKDAQVGMEYLQRAAWHFDTKAQILLEQIRAEKRAHLAERISNTSDSLTWAA